MLWWKKVKYDGWRHKDLNIIWKQFLFCYFSLHFLISIIWKIIVFLIAMQYRTDTETCPDIWIFLTNFSNSFNGRYKENLLCILGCRELWTGINNGVKTRNMVYFNDVKQQNLGCRTLVAQDNLMQAAATRCTGWSFVPTLVYYSNRQPTGQAK